MRRQLQVHFFVACILALAERADGQAVATTMKPIRYCSDKKWWGCKTRGYPYGSFWENAGMSNDNQDKAFFAIMGSAPSRSNVEYVVLFSSGQQGSSGGSSGDAANVVSGAYDDWKWNTNENPSEPRSVDSRSIAAKFYNDQTKYLPHSKTLYLTLWDAQFNHMASTGEKEDTLDGYSDFLNSKVYWANIKGIILVGSSRGGCLAMRLSQHLRARYNLNHVQFAVGSVDGVCKYSQDELGTTSSTINNPVATSGYKAYKTAMDQQFVDKSNYCILHLVGGEEVTGLALGVRPFTHDTCTSVSCTLTENGETWYKQTWNDLCHQCAGRDYNEADITIDPMLAISSSAKLGLGGHEHSQLMLVQEQINSRQGEELHRQEDPGGDSMGVGPWPSVPMECRFNLDPHQQTSHDLWQTDVASATI
eukprot:CAMPEP_0181295124 /NCGR_PEP_ID=MMETSP1101-20121128/3974_1 /TAXON_ID=46948 /ORGANISM="Rhodomonas abbreviata, Strain Caron Lab Isolate" /LENGTH=419 /DNA_ID=CAMNT_0023399843 /DNA_START=83 /DNA_END=1343 /DNA_ORIENTATION=+